jgi:tetratricopeptide (TPR) repeat protein
LSLAAAAFPSFLILAISGIFKEFTFKTGFVEITSKLSEKIDDVQTDVNESKTEVKEKIAELNQNISNIQSMVIANRFNASVSPIFNVGLENLRSIAKSADDRLDQVLSEEGVKDTIELQAKPKEFGKQQEINFLSSIREQADKTIESLTNRSPKFDVDKALKEANYHYIKGEYEKANEIYDRILSDNPHDFYALLNKGVCLMRLYDIKAEPSLLTNAATLLQKAHQVNSGDVSALINVGVCNLKLNKADKALNYLEKARRLEPDNATLNYNLACAYSKLGNVSHALDYLKKAVEADRAFKSRAKSDPDFNNIKNTDEFKTITS